MAAAIMFALLHHTVHVHSVHVVWHAHVRSHVHLIIDWNHARLNCRIAQAHHVRLYSCKPAQLMSLVPIKRTDCCKDATLIVVHLQVVWLHDT